MLLDLFSSFDFCLSVFCYVVLVVIWWVVMVYVVFLRLSLFPYVGNRWVRVFFYKRRWIPKLKKVGGLYLFVRVLWFFLVVRNIVGLFPYVFSLTSHFFLKLVFSFWFWLYAVLLNCVGGGVKFVRSFVPFGRPLLLSFFLNIIEVVRVLIRLLTLAVRLMVNVTTGHIFLGLLGGVVVFSGGALVIVGLYFSFEVGIMLIQSYVFSLLVLQYVEV